MILLITMEAFLIKSPLSWSHQSSYFFPLLSASCHRPLAPSCCHLQLEEQPDSWKKSSVLWHETFPCKSWMDTFAPAGQQLIQMKYFLCKNCWCSIISSVFSSAQKSLYWGVVTVQFLQRKLPKDCFPFACLPMLQSFGSFTTALRHLSNACKWREEWWKCRGCSVGGGWAVQLQQHYQCPFSPQTLWPLVSTHEALYQQW